MNCLLHSAWGCGKHPVVVAIGLTALCCLTYCQPEPVGTMVGSPTPTTKKLYAKTKQSTAKRGHNIEDRAQHLKRLLARVTHHQSKSDTTSRNRLSPGDSVRVEGPNPPPMSLIQVGAHATHQKREIPAAAVNGACTSSSYRSSGLTVPVVEKGAAGGKTGSFYELAAKSRKLTNRKAKQAIVTTNQPLSTVTLLDCWSQNGTESRSPFRGYRKLTGPGYPVIHLMRFPVGCAQLNSTQIVINGTWKPPIGSPDLPMARRRREGLAFGVHVVLQANAAGNSVDMLNEDASRTRN